ncbi:DUF4221 family protein [Lunatimonas salinarum]|uniref:DUF4221 family protein n=1 Tax=Lunatimonas salinarum TaxID=1774590 RepID=UPI001AE06EF2|nr:DUF4221 family protein [Lunatimonas salinarum]
MVYSHISIESFHRSLTFCFLFAAYILLAACGSAIQEQAVPDKVLQNAENKLRIPLDDQTGNFSYGLGYLDGEKSYLFNIQSPRNEIQVYDMDRKELAKTLKFDVEGSQGVGTVFGFHVHSADSIFLFTTHPGSIYLTDIDQSYLSTISFTSPEGYSGPQVRSSFFNSYPIIRGDKILAKVVAPGNIKDTEEKVLSKQVLSIELDMNSGDTELTSHKYPQGYLSDGLRVPYYSMAASPDQVVYSFLADHNLYAASSAGDLLDAIPAKSRFFPETFPTLSRTAERDEVLRYMFTEPRYGLLLYDPYREVFYRFCFPKIEIESEEELEQLRGFAKDFSIMILDRNLQVLGETRFKGYNYVTENVFVAKEGLYISVNHPDNYDNDEDYLSFVLYELADKK